jgi:hypothetical protein
MTAYFKPACLPVKSLMENHLIFNIIEGVVIHAGEELSRRESHFI